MSVCFQKLCKSTYCCQKFVPALFVAYLPWFHVGDCINQGSEPRNLLASKIPFDWGSFSDQFEPPFVEQISNFQEKIGGSTKHRPIFFNLREPNIQKGHEIGLATFSSKIVSVPTVLGFSPSGEKMSENRDRRTADEEDNAGRGCVVLAYRRLCGWPDLWLAGLPAWQRPCSQYPVMEGSLELPYPNGSNTCRFYMTYVV
jgi:hypothetical protein